MIGFGQRGHRALAPAAARALLDRDGGRNAEDRIDVGACRRLHELPRIGVQRFQVAALSLGEEDVEGKRALAAARDAGHDGEAVARNVDVDVLEVMLARVVDSDGGVVARCGRRIRCRSLACAQRRSRCHRRFIILQRDPGVRRCARHHLAHGAGDDHLASGLAAFRAEVDDPVGGADHVEIVLDHDAVSVGRACGTRSASRCRRSAARWSARRKERACLSPAAGRCAARDRAQIRRPGPRPDGPRASAAAPRRRRV